MLLNSSWDNYSNSLDRKVSGVGWWSNTWAKGRWVVLVMLMKIARV